MMPDNIILTSLYPYLLHSGTWPYRPARFDKPCRFLLHWLWLSLYLIIISCFSCSANETEYLLGSWNTRSATDKDGILQKPLAARQFKLPDEVSSIFIYMNQIVDGMVDRIKSKVLSRPFDLPGSFTFHISGSPHTLAASSRLSSVMSNTVAPAPSRVTFVAHIIRSMSHYLPYSCSWPSLHDRRVSGAGWLWGRLWRCPHF